MEQYQKGIIMSPTMLLIVSKLGYAVLTELLEYKYQKKGGRGVIGMKKTARNGSVADTAIIAEHKTVDSSFEDLFRRCDIPVTDTVDEFLRVRRIENH